VTSACSSAPRRLDRPGPTSDRRLTPCSLARICSPAAEQRTRPPWPTERAESSPTKAAERAPASGRPPHHHRCRPHPKARGGDSWRDDGRPDPRIPQDGDIEHPHHRRSVSRASTSAPGPYPATDDHMSSRQCPQPASRPRRPGAATRYIACELPSQRATPVRQARPVPHPRTVELAALTRTSWSLERRRDLPGGQLNSSYGDQDRRMDTGRRRLLVEPAP